MDKSYVLTFSISVLVLLTFGIIGLMLMIPQKNTYLISSVPVYESIDTTKYRFEQTKDISEENLVHEYIVRDTDLENFKRSSQLVSGNSDPFTPQEDLNTASDTNNSNTANNNTTNSNGGTSNPSSSNNGK